MFGMSPTYDQGMMPQGLNGSGADMISSVLLVYGRASTIAPKRTKFAFLEIQAPGGNVGAQTGTRSASGGGGASDAIVPCSEGDVVLATLSQETPNTPQSTCTIALNGIVIASAQQAPTVQGQGIAGAGGVGKYPGFPALDRNGPPGRGGGRLSPAVFHLWESADVATIGAGRRNEAATTYGGQPVGHASFFTTYKAALAYANACYGGNWTP